MRLLTENIPKNLYQMKSSAKSNKLGIWSMEFDYPWDWRKKN